MLTNNIVFHMWYKQQHSIDRDSHIPCRVCGDPTRLTTLKECIACHKVMGYITEFIKTANGLKFVKTVLAKQ